MAGWSGPTEYYQHGPFYADGTVNMTATLGKLEGPVRFFADINGAMWVGWTDIDTANHVTYAGYLAKFQGQIFPS